jgi:acetyl esterase/lipase
VGHDAPFERDASPANIVTKDFPPTFVFVAEMDSLIPSKQSYELYESLKALGVDAEIGVGLGMEHGQIEGLGQWEKLEDEKGWWGQVVLPALTFALKRLV